MFRLGQILCPTTPPLLSSSPPLLFDQELTADMPVILDNLSLIVYIAAVSVLLLSAHYCRH